MQQQQGRLQKAIADEDGATAFTILQRELRAAMVPLAKAREKLGDALTVLDKLPQDDEAAEGAGPLRHRAKRAHARLWRESVAALEKAKVP